MKTISLTTTGAEVPKEKLNLLMIVSIVCYISQSTPRFQAMQATQKKKRVICLINRSTPLLPRNRLKRIWTILIYRIISKSNHQAMGFMKITLSTWHQLLHWISNKWVRSTLMPRTFLHQTIWLWQAIITCIKRRLQNIMARWQLEEV